jgi:hypothetical protein
MTNDFSSACPLSNLYFSDEELVAALARFRLVLIFLSVNSVDS